jgi:hypothetical protein
MAQRSRGGSPRARYERRRRRGEGPGRHREVTSGGSPIHTCGATPRHRRCGVGPPGTSGHGTTTSALRAGGVLATSGVDARTVLCLPLGGLPAVRARAEAEANCARRHPSRSAGRSQQRVSSARGRVRKARTGGRRAHRLWARGHAPAQPLERPFAERRGEAAVGASARDVPVRDVGRMERVVERGHLPPVLT